jgi:hypothetical protein
MKLHLPHREVNLDSNLSYEDRNKVIFALLEETIEFHEQTMTVESYFRYTWNKQPTKVSMDIIGYYLTKNNMNEAELEEIEDENEKETNNSNNNKEDRWVISNKKQKEMRKGSKRHTTFSGMGYENQVKVGLIEADDVINN